MGLPAIAKPPPFCLRFPMATAVPAARRAGRRSPHAMRLARLLYRILAQNMCTSSPTRGTAKIQCPSAGPGDPAGLFNINPIAISILQLKLPNGSDYVPGSGTSGYVAQNFLNPAGFKDHQGIGNVDYVINSKNTFSGRYIYETDPLNANFPAVNALEPGNSVPGNTISTTKINQDTIAKVTTLLSRQCRERSPLRIPAKLNQQ